MNMEVQMSGIGKTFGSTRALDNVEFQARRGSAHAIVGENGAGKTTLMNILYGVFKPTEGTIMVRGSKVDFRSPEDALRVGIGMVSQHYSIIPELTCIQNLILGAEGGEILPTSSLTEKAQALAERMKFRFNWHVPAAELGPAGCQKLEILKLLWRDSKIMILDEPSAMLAPSDTDALFQSLEELRREGRTVLLVTHRLPEVMDFCEDVTVLRRGRKVASMKVSETTARDLAELIVGHPIEVSAPHPRSPSRVLLEVRSLSVQDERGHRALRSASFKVEEGEVLGVAGVDGNGQKELVQGLLGLARASGSIRLGDVDISNLPTRDRLSLGIRVIPEDRHREAILESWNLVENAALGLQALPPISRRKFIDLRSVTSLAKRAADLFQTRYASLNQPIRGLSGGNQQRFVAGRALQLEPKLLLAFQPARGLDLDATQRLYDEIRARCRATGMAAIVIAFDLDELLSQADRIVVLHDGALLELPEGAPDRQVIGRLMVGAA